jgi:hypothetical protein
MPICGLHQDHATRQPLHKFHPDASKMNDLRRLLLWVHIATRLGLRTTCCQGHACGAEGNPYAHNVLMEQPSFTHHMCSCTSYLSMFPDADDQQSVVLPHRLQWV